MAAIGGWPIQLLICALGLAVTALGVTGILILIWLKMEEGGADGAGGASCAFGVSSLRHASHQLG